MLALCGAIACAIATISSCCQQISTTPLIEATAAASWVSLPFQKLRSTVISSFAASGVTVSSGRRLLLPPWPAAISARFAGADAYTDAGVGNPLDCPSDGLKNSAHAPALCQPAGVSDFGSSAPLISTPLSASVWGFSA